MTNTRKTPHNEQVRGLSEANLPKAVEIETASYPEDEAASPENMRFRRANAGDFFLEATLKTAVSIGCKRHTHAPLTGMYTIAHH